MTCARRLAGARTPAPSTSAGSPRWPDARTGRARARGFTLLLPVLALLAGAFWLFAPAPAEAQTTTVWSATLNVKSATGFGCNNSHDPTASKCSTAATLSDDDFTHGGATYTFHAILDNPLHLSNKMVVTFVGLTGAAAKTALTGLTLNVGSTPFAIGDATVQSSELYWPSSLGLSVGDTVSLSLTQARQTTTPTEDPPSASPNLAWKAWLARFGRTVGSQVADAVSERLAGGLAPGARATLAGQPVDLSKTDDNAGGGEPGTGTAKARNGLSDPWHGPGAATRTRTVTVRELPPGSSFHVAGTGGGRRPGLAAWGRVSRTDFDGEEASGAGRLDIGGEVLTGTIGADADWGRTLAGVAVSLSGGDGRFGDSGATTGAKGRIESRMTTVSPYARFKVTERVSAWGLAGLGRGDMKIRFDDGSMDPVKTDLSMRLGALGARGKLMEQGEAGGPGMDLGLDLDMDLALKADAFFVRTKSGNAENAVPAAANASRMRLMLEGGRRYGLAGGRALRPSLELGLRHDGGDAETGAGLEIGGGVSYADPSSGLSVEAKARMLAAHADSDYREWGAGASARLDPGERGRGLSFSLAPAIGAAPGAPDRLWGARDARGLAPGGKFEAARGVRGEMGYGLPALGGRFTHTPNVGFGTADGGARDYRMGWRLAPAAGAGFEVSLDATRREAANGGASEHGVMLRSLIRW